MLSGAIQEFGHVTLLTNATAENAAEIGRKAGDAAGAQLLQECGDKSAEDVASFLVAMEKARDAAVAYMRENGSSEPNVAAWIEAFGAAFAPYLDAWAAPHAKVAAAQARGFAFGERLAEDGLALLSSTAPGAIEAYLNGAFAGAMSRVLPN